MQVQGVWVAVVVVVVLVKQDAGRDLVITPAAQMVGCPFMVEDGMQVVQSEAHVGHGARFKHLHVRVSVVVVGVVVVVVVKQDAGRDFVMAPIAH